MSSLTISRSCHLQWSVVLCVKTCHFRVTIGATMAPPVDTPDFFSRWSNTVWLRMTAKYFNALTFKYFLKTLKIHTVWWYFCKSRPKIRYYKKYFSKYFLSNLGRQTIQTCIFICYAWMFSGTMIVGGPTVHGKYLLEADVHGVDDGGWWGGSGVSGDSNGICEV